METIEGEERVGYQIIYRGSLAENWPQLTPLEAKINSASSTSLTGGLAGFPSTYVGSDLYTTTKLGAPEELFYDFFLFVSV